MNESEDLSAILRDALHDEASRVQPGGEGLAAIRSRTAARAPWYRRSWVAGAATAAVATAATVVGVTLLTDPGGSTAGGPVGQGQQSTAPAPTTAAPDSPSPSDNAPSTPATPSSSAPTSPAPSNSGSPRPVAVESVPVYYVGDSDFGPRLYREFHSTPAPDGAGVAAVSEMLKGEPIDPDYGAHSWGSDVRSVSHADGVITVDLTRMPDPYPAARITEELAQLTVQQLVYTVQAALGSTDPVMITVDGSPVDSILGVDTSQPIPRADPLGVQAMIWVTRPAQGQTVDSPVRLAGIANTFEANVSWEVLQGDSVVDSGFTTAEAGMEFSPFATKIPLPPGDYTLRVFESSAEDGRAINVDTKDFTVR